MTGIVSSLIPSSSEPIVAVYNEFGAEIFVDESSQNLIAKTLGLSNKAQPMTLSVQDESRVFSHPLDNNDTMADHKINLLIGISIEMVIARDSQNVIFNNIRSYKSLGMQCSVKTKAGTYDRLVVSSCSHRESVDYFNAIVVTVRFTEYQKGNSYEAPVMAESQQNSIKRIGQVAMVA